MLPLVRRASHIVEPTQWGTLRCLGTSAHPVGRSADHAGQSRFGALSHRILPGATEARLVPLNDCFTPTQLAALAGDQRPFDCEGVAQDEQGRFYLCEERRRWILRCDPKTGRVERLPIDWSSVKDYFSPVDSNASFEGIAIGKGKLYVANERSSPLIIVVDLASLRVKGHFLVYPKKSSFFGMHYSDLCWFDGKLWSFAGNIEWCWKWSRPRTPSWPSLITARSRSNSVTARACPSASWKDWRSTATRSGS